MKRQLTTFSLLIATVCATMLTSCKSYNVASRFSSKYINANQGKITVGVSEAFELGQAMLALTQVAQNDTTLVNRNSVYYQDLMQWMKGHENHKGVVQLNAMLSRNPQFAQSYVDGLYAFDLHEGRFALKANYRIDVNKVDFKRYALLLESFYKTTGFHEFYMRHQNLYAQLQQEAKNSYSFETVQKQSNVNVTQAEAKGYQVVVSPLINKCAGTLAIVGHAYSEYVIFPKLATGRTYAFKN